MMKNRRYSQFMWLLPVATLGWVNLQCTDNTSSEGEVGSGWGKADEFGSRTLRFPGINYSPLRTAPTGAAQHNTYEEIVNDLQMLSQYTDTIRIYSPNEQIVQAAAEVGLKVYIGSYPGHDQRASYENPELADLLSVATNSKYEPWIKGLIVGNEDILECQQSYSSLLEMVTFVKAELAQAGVGLPVSVAMIGPNWRTNPTEGIDSVSLCQFEDNYKYNPNYDPMVEAFDDLVAAVDFIFFQAHPYWAGTTIAEAVPYLLDDEWRAIRRNTAAVVPESVTKPMVLGETGWPTAGEERGAAASVENQRIFLADLRRVAVVDYAGELPEEPFEYILFTSFDERWKIYDHGKYERKRREYVEACVAQSTSLFSYEQYLTRQQLVQDEGSTTYHLLNETLATQDEGSARDGLQGFDRCPTAIHIARLGYGLDEQAYAEGLEAAINADFAGYWYDDANRPEIERHFVEGWWGIFTEDRTPKYSFAPSTPRPAADPDDA
jgi:exo-beta-1,3-glucanase (GH17 family)